jgi:uncharacterized protein Usg
MNDNKRLRLVKDFRLVTIGVFYYLPEYNNIIQEFVWQTDDCVPELVRVHKFLNYWNEHIEAKIQEVRISYANPFLTTDFKHINYEFPIYLT